MTLSAYSMFAVPNARLHKLSMVLRQENANECLSVQHHLESQTDILGFLSWCQEESGGLFAWHLPTCSGTELLYFLDILFLIVSFTDLTFFPREMREAVGDLMTSLYTKSPSLPCKTE